MYVRPVGGERGAMANEKYQLSRETDYIDLFLCENISKMAVELERNEILLLRQRFK